MFHLCSKSLIKVTPCHRLGIVVKVGIHRGCSPVLVVSVIPCHSTPPVCLGIGNLTLLLESVRFLKDLVVLNLIPVTYSLYVNERTEPFCIVDNIVPVNIFLCLLPILETCCDTFYPVLSQTKTFSILVNLILAHSKNSVVVDKHTCQLVNAKTFYISYSCSTRYTRQAFSKCRVPGTFLNGIENIPFPCQFIKLT